MDEIFKECLNRMDVKAEDLRREAKANEYDFFKAEFNNGQAQGLYTACAWLIREMEMNENG